MAHANGEEVLIDSNATRNFGCKEEIQEQSLMIEGQQHGLLVKGKEGDCSLTEIGFNDIEAKPSREDMEYQKSKQ